MHTTTLPSPPSAEIQVCAPEARASFLDGFAAIHDAMRRDARRLVLALASPRTPDDAAGLVRWYATFRKAIEHHHVREDDVVWPDLVRRDPGFAEHLASLAEDHHHLDAAMARMHETLTAMAASPTAARATALDAAEALCDLLHDHLHREEGAAFGPLGRCYTPGEYEAIEKAMARGMTLRDLAFVVPWVLDGAEPRDTAEMTSMLPALVRLLHRLVFTRRYRGLTAPLVGAAGPSHSADVGTVDPVRRRLMVLVNRVVNRIVRLTGTQRFRGAQLLYLTTVGRQTGKPRTVPLAFVRDDGDYVVAASNGGNDWEPAWWLNLRCTPRATIEVDRTEMAVTAAEIDDRDRDRLWKRLSDQLDTYDHYQSKVRRQIALVRLRPLGNPMTPTSRH